MTRYLATLFLSTVSFYMCAQTDNQHSAVDDITYKVEIQTSTGIGDHTPLWLNANKYGLSSLALNNGYLRGALERDINIDDERKWGVGYGLDMIGAYHHESKAFIQQAYISGRWRHGTFTVGSKEYPMALKNQQLSSGSQTFGINARPIPQVRLSLDDYWLIPYTRGLLRLKGHIAYGFTTDDAWQKRFTNSESKFTEHVLYHSKAGYLRIGNDPEFYPFSVELGAEMACQFGGTSYNMVNEGDVMKGESGIKSVIHALIPGGSDAYEGQYQNVGGNHLGSWMMRINLDYDTWYLGVYGEHFFEDQSAMFMLDYDGYGSGEHWNHKSHNRYLLYDLKDMMLGAELKLKGTGVIDNIVFEYLYTKYQSGGIYHDRTANIADHIGGADNYYNHFVYTGWQHWGQVIGNPLYQSPLYNSEGKIQVDNNRFYAFHLGMSGNPCDQLSYRFLATYEKGFGTYALPYDRPRYAVDLLLEASYRFLASSIFKGWNLRLGLGADLGTLRGQNWGAQFTVARTGIINLKKKKR